MERKWITKEEAKKIYPESPTIKLMPISDFWFKKLGKMISDPDYDLNERFAPRLLDWGFIDIVKMGYQVGKFLCHSTYYIVTESGKEAYNQWKEGNK